MGRVEDGALVRRILQGDTPAFRRIVEEHQGRIFYLGLKFFRRFEEAEDFTQEVFLKAYRKLPTFEARSTFSAWLYRLGFNLAVSRYRRQSRALLEIGLENADSLADDGGRTVSDWADEETLRAALRELPAFQQVVLKMIFFDGLSYRETERITGIKANTLKSHVFRAKALIRQRLTILSPKGKEGVHHEKRS